MNHVSQTSIFSRLSIVLSSLCILHCLAFPFVILALPAAAQFLGNTIESILILSVIPLSILAFVPTWLKHKNRRNLQIYLGSLCLLLFGHFVFSHAHTGGVSFESVMETILVISGALGLAWVIYRNNRHTHVCTNPHHHH